MEQLNQSTKLLPCNHLTGDGDTAVDIYGVCTHCSQIMEGSVQLNTSFIPCIRGGTMSEEQVLPEFGMPCRESQIAALQDKLAQSEAERERLRADASKTAEELARVRQELKHLTYSRDNWKQLTKEWEEQSRHHIASKQQVEAELARERERHQELRQVVKEYRTSLWHGRYCGHHYAHDPCKICIKADALLESKAEPAPVATGEEKE